MALALFIHSIIRWLIVAFALIVCIKLSLGWWRGMKFGGLDNGLLAGFTATMDTQVLFGLVYFFWNGLSGAGFPHYRLEHMLIMLVAAIFAHLPARWKRLDDRMRCRRSFFSVLASLAIVLAGVARLPGGWTR